MIWLPKMTLFVLIFGLTWSAGGTTTYAAAPPPTKGFNALLNLGGCKSTQPDHNAGFTVVVDAGHGGKDPGGMGANSSEKHIALRISQLFATGIQNRYPEVEVVLTRNDDTFIPLYERAAIANNEGADLFISVHANIMPGSAATYGTETFVMGQHVAEHNLDVAKRENASVLLEDNYEKNYDYDPNSDEGHILMSMFQHAFLERSILFAELVEREFASIGRKSRGVKQAGFVVLKETTMPSVLVETGFMSNSTEEAYLLSAVGQEKLAAALLNAFGKYYTGVSGTPPQTVMARAEKRMAPRATSPKGPGPVPVPTQAPAVLRKEIAANLGGRPDVVAPTAYASFRPPLVAQRDTVPVPRNLIGEADTKDKRVARDQPQQPTLDLTKIPDRELTYAIQMMATRQQVDLSTERYRQLPFRLYEFRENGLWKYQLRGMSGPADVKLARSQLKLAGFTEMMNVVYYRGQRLRAASVRWLLAR